MSKILTDELILEAIDKGLSLLGDSPKQALWFCLEKDFNFDRCKVPENLEAFEETLNGIFGLGYRFLLAHFVQNLHEATGENLQSYKTFAECVHGVREKAENARGQII
jgi:hypothetical protein